MATKSSSTTPRRGGKAKGSPKTGGRQKGTPNKRTIGREAMLGIATTPMTKKQAAEGKGPKRLTPLEFLTRVFNTRATGKNRIPLGYQIDAAKAAAPYVHPKKISVVSKNVNLNVGAQAAGEGGIDADALYREIMGDDGSELEEELDEDEDD